MFRGAGDKPRSGVLPQKMFALVNILYKPTLNQYTTIFGIDLVKIVYLTQIQVQKSTGVYRGEAGGGGVNGVLPLLSPITAHPLNYNLTKSLPSCI